MSEKTEQATTYKLKKAREKGQVNKSTELNTYGTLLIALALLNLMWPSQLVTVQNMVRHLFNLAAHLNFTTNNVVQLTKIVSTSLIFLWLPLALTVFLAIVLSTLVQTGLTWSPAALSPNFNRLNVGTGIKKLFSLTPCFEAIKSLVKLICSFTALIFIFKTQLTYLVQSALTQPVTTSSHLMMRFILNTSLQIILILVLLALVDKKFTHWKFNKDQRMSKQEVKEEYRQKEGDPKIKNKIRQLQFQLRQKTAALQQIKTADVIITNPTHIAIALKYERGAMPAPKVVFKAQNKMVGPIKELARKYSIPIVENKLLARMLHYSTDLNQYINKELFPLTAQVFRELYRQGVSNE